MSHIVEIETEVRDAVAACAACRRLGLPEPVQGSFELFGGLVEGLGIQLDGWQYPVVCDLASGQVRFDNFGGRWGDQTQLDRFLQAYAIEKATIEARKKGHSVTEQVLANGAVKLTVRLGGAA
ncbi:hypothetical protein Pan216_04090 [Planctomycetes bacterium Pan216]|uniref:DUF1257 domain-containing protein n=1 Tax=Kolteria novifilia TaxID=2527975 RepID=A0A518AXX0_9BACT|nr:hypothetical protein Pan216_04090 [Planctomycetes bacterium Pan216]